VGTSGLEERHTQVVGGFRRRRLIAGLSICLPRGVEALGGLRKAALPESLQGTLGEGLRREVEIGHKVMSSSSSATLRSWSTGIVLNR